MKDRSPGAAGKLAQTLLDNAAKTAAGSPDQFVLLNGAISAAEEGQNLRICFTAAKLLATGYGIDELATKADAVTKVFSRSVSTSSASVGNIEEILSLADQLVAEDAFTTVAAVESALQRAATGISEEDLKAEVKNQIREVTTLRETRERIAPAIEKLKQSPDDPAANLAVGGYLCFRRGQWAAGLPLLAKSSDAQLKNLAKTELAQPTASDEMLKLADGWLAAAPKLAAPNVPGRYSTPRRCIASPGRACRGCKQW